MLIPPRKKSKSSNQVNAPYYDRNDRIRVPSVKVIDDEGNNLGDLNTQEALQIAQERDLDLVLISPNTNPPVAKIMSWSKFKYDQSKKKRDSKSKKTEVKEMWFKPKIEEGDIEHKVKRVKEFIEKGDRVKITIKAKGRVTRDHMKETLGKVLEHVEEFAIPDTKPQFEGRNYSVFVKREKHEKKDTQSDS